MATFGYVRVSTISQVEGDSLETQRKQIQGYAMSKGLHLTDEQVFVEEGVSGGTNFEDRPEGGRLLQMLIEGDTVTYSKLDRAFSNTRNALNVLHSLKELGVNAHFIDRGGDVTSKGIGQLVCTIPSAFATFERERTATLIREVKQMRKSEGKFTGGRRAFGFKIVDGRKAPLEKEQSIIKEMRRKRTIGVSYRLIADWLREDKGVRMSHVAVRNLLGSLKMQDCRQRRVKIQTMRHQALSQVIRWT